MVLRWLIRAALAGPALFLLVAVTPLAWYAGQPLRDAGDPLPADAIVLFSSGQIDDRWLTLDADQRLLGALDLWRRGLAPVIVSSGSEHDHDRREAELESEWLARAGVPPEALLVESRSTRTYESVAELKAMMRARGWSRLAIVSSDLDVARIRMVCARLGVQASFLGVPEVRPPAPGSLLYLGSGYPALYHAMYEYAAILLYRWRGWV